MNVDVEPRRSRWSRFLLLAGGVGLAWCAFTTLGQSASASAAEDDPNGLLGVVSSTVHQTASAATTVIDAVEPAVTGAVQDVIHAAVPPAPAPTPHTPAPASAIAPVIHGVADAATAAVSRVTHTSTATLQGAADTADVLTGAVADTTTGILSDVAIFQALSPLLAAAVDDLQLLGAVTSELALAETLGSTLAVVDDLLEVVVGTATTIVGNPGQPGTGGILPRPDGLLPGDPTQPIPVLLPAGAGSLTAQQALVFGGLFAGTLAIGSIVPIVGASATGSTRGGGSPLAPSGPVGAPGALSPASASAASLWAALIEYSWRTLARVGAALSLSNDALPGAPVFATDVSPD